MAPRPARSAALRGADALTSRGRGRRIAAALALAILAGALVWWRSPVAKRPVDADFAIVSLALPEQPGDAPLRATGLWRLDGSGAGFGGFSALLALNDGRLRAFSDRGWRLTFRQPGRGPADGHSALVLVAPGFRNDLFDIESATRDDANGDFWLGYEYVHAIHRFTVAGEAGPVRALGSEVDWPSNAGLEALVRLDDGRFVGFSETGLGVIFAGDPTEGAPMESFTVRWPESDYAPTDAAQLPDGRVLVLMRRFEPGLPMDFHSLLAIGAAPQAGALWRPEVLAHLGEYIPRENYEGLAIRPRDAGGAEIWLVSDDNFSAFQRTLLARLEWSGGQ